MAKQNSKQDSASAATAASQGGLGGQPSGGLASYGSLPMAVSHGAVRLLVYPNPNPKPHPTCNPNSNSSLALTLTLPVTLSHTLTLSLTLILTLALTRSCTSCPLPL